MQPSESARESGWLSHPAALWSKHNGAYEWEPDPGYHAGSPRSYDPQTQIETMLAFGEHPIKGRHTSLSELQLLSRLTGFEITEMYGDAEDMRPFTGGPDNDYVIIVERR